MLFNDEAFAQIPGQLAITLTGLEGPKGRKSRADMGAAARRSLQRDGIPTVGAWYGGLQPHGPAQRPCEPWPPAFGSQPYVRCAEGY